MAAAYYDIGTAGEMHHNPAKNVLYVAATVASLAVPPGPPPEPTSARRSSARAAKLLAARSARPAPFVDRTRYTNWNAMMASAMLRAGAVLGDDEARRHAILTLARLRRERVADDAVAHTPGGVTGLLDDQVQVAAAALDAYEATGEAGWLTWAEQLMDRVWADYWDEAKGGLFDTAPGGRRSRACCRRGPSRYRMRRHRRRTASPASSAPACTSSPVPLAGASGGSPWSARSRDAPGSSGSTPRRICWRWTGCSHPPPTS